MGVWEKREHNREVVSEREAALAACSPFLCEAGGCNRHASPSYVCTDEGGVEGHRYLCATHWEQWRRPNDSLAAIGAYPLRVALMEKWGWQGNPWYVS